MRALLLSLFLVAALVPANAEPMAFDFGGERYTVDYQARVKQPDGTAGQGIAEFTLKGETVDNWTKLIGYHYYPEQVGTPSQAAANLGKYLKEINKDFTYALFNTKENDDAIIEFTTWEGNGEMIEFDVFKYARPEAGPGVIALQFAQRLKLKDMSVEEFQALRERAALTTARMNAIPGMSCVAPRGAFYAMPKVELPKGKTDVDFVLGLLRAKGILTVYGSGFGTAPEDGFFRIVFLATPQDLGAIYDDVNAFTRAFLGV